MNHSMPLYCRPMRRWLAILLMVFMPLQLGWAAMSVYCQHEAGAAAEHFGHHEHAHQGDSTDTDGAFKSDPDCGFCQMASLAAMPSCATAAVTTAIEPVITPLAHPAPRSAPSTEPERPKWGCPA